MVAVANFQYSWTLFARPLERERGWTPVQIQDALNLFFILAQTWLVPLEAYLAERFGPRRLLVLGGLLAGLGWVINSRTESLAVRYAAQVAAGCGSGIVYGISVGGVALLVLIRNTDNPVLFVLMSGLAFFGWGAVFSLFPAVSCDIFGREYATTNYALLYTAKGAATVLSSLCNRLQAATGSWELIFTILIVADWLAAVLALAVLRPLRRRLAERLNAAQPSTGELAQP